MAKTIANNHSVFEFPWSDNWNWFQHLRNEPKIRTWIRDYLCGEEQLHVLVLAGAETAASMIRVLSNYELQFKAGWPLPVTVAGVFTEGLTTQSGADDARAMDRIYRHLLSWEEFQSGEWNPRSPAVLRYMRSLDEAMREIQARQPYLNLPRPSYLDPNSEAGWKHISAWSEERVQRTGGRPFSMILSGPYGKWIARRLRKTAGELATPFTEQHPHTGEIQRRFELLECEVPDAPGLRLPTHGLAWGAHPSGPTGGIYDFAHYAGASASLRLLEEEQESGRMNLMGLGPRSYDDFQLHALQTAPIKLGVHYDTDQSDETKHYNGRHVLSWWAKHVETWMRGDGTRNSEHLGHVIARHLLTMYYARHGGVLHENAKEYQNAFADT